MQQRHRHRALDKIWSAVKAWGISIEEDTQQSFVTAEQPEMQRDQLVEGIAYTSIAEVDNPGRTPVVRLPYSKNMVRVQVAMHQRGRDGTVDEALKRGKVAIYLD